MTYVPRIGCRASFRVVWVGCGARMSRGCAGWCWGGVASGGPASWDKCAPGLVGCVVWGVCPGLGVKKSRGVAWCPGGVGVVWHLVAPPLGQMCLGA